MSTTIAVVLAAVVLVSFVRHRSVRAAGRSGLVALMGASILALGCASTVPEPQFSQPIAPESRIAGKDEAQVNVRVASGVAMAESEKARLGDKIRTRIGDRQSRINRAGETRTFAVDVVVTQYEKGDAFARAMLAGLGQIHIDAEVKLLEMPAGKQVGAFSLSKTFAWGGAYGGSVSVEEIEDTFAEGVAAALAGQP